MDDALYANVRTELIHALGHSSLLRFLGAHHPDMKDLRRLLETSEILHVPDGRSIIHEGQESDRMYFLVSGEVIIERGGKQIASMARMGDVFGEFGAMTGELRSATVIAKGPVTCLATDRGFARRLAKSENAALILLMQRAMSRILMERLTQTSRNLADTEARLREREEQLAAQFARNQELESKLQALSDKGAQAGLDWPKRRLDHRRDHT